MKISFKTLSAALFFQAFCLSNAHAQYISSGDLGIGLIVAEDPQQQILNLYKVEGDGEATLLQSNIFPESTLNTFSASKSIVDTSTGKIYLKEPDQGGGLRYRVYNAATNEFEGYTTISNLPDGTSPSFLGAPVQLNKVARREGDELHIGENSFITRERNGKQEIYARDADGNAIPLNVARGSDLLIDGVSVMGSIDENAEDIETNKENIEVNRKNISTNTNNISTNASNISTNANNISTNSNNISTNANNIETNRKNINDLGFGVAGATALTAALSSLPVAAENAPLSCGLGTGGYSSRFAIGVGCASKLSDRISVNVGGAHVFGGSANYGGGSLDTVSARAGLVIKLGTIHKPSSITKEELQSQLDGVRQENKKLLARLERLEAIALAPEESVSEVSLK